MFEDLDKNKDIVNNFTNKDGEIISKSTNSTTPKGYSEKVNNLKESIIFSNIPKPNKSQKFKKIKVLIFFVVIVILLVLGFIFFKDNIKKYFDITMSTFVNKSTNITEQNIPDTEDIIDEIENIPSITTTTTDTEITTSTEQVIELKDNVSIEKLLDSDKDGLLDVYEDIYKTDKNNKDSDKDTYLDGAEVINGYDPNSSQKDTSDKNLFYFAYGSNMNLEIMRSRCGEENFIGFSNSYLDNYTFYFYGRGFANIKELKGDKVYGVLYKINDSCLKGLDRSEGYPNLYQRREVKIQNNFGNFNAQVYIVENDDTKSNPSDSYFESITSGATQYSLPENYIEYIKSLK